MDDMLLSVSAKKKVSWHTPIISCIPYSLDLRKQTEVRHKHVLLLDLRQQKGVLPKQLLF